MMPHIVLCPPCLIDALLQVFILQLLGDEGMILIGKPDVCVNDTDVADHHSIVFSFCNRFRRRMPGVHCLEMLFGHFYLCTTGILHSLVGGV